MSPADALRFSLRALLAHRLRTSLSLVGMTIGVAAVVILTALGEGARVHVIDQFASIGTNLLIVVPGKTETTGAFPGIGGAPNDLTLEDAEAISRELRRVNEVAPISMGTEVVSHLERRRQAAIVGATPPFMKVRKLRVQHSQFLPDEEWQRGAAVAVIGAKVASELFPADDPLGKVVRIGGWRMKVIGILARRGVQLGVDLDEVVVVPVTTGMRMLDRSSLFRILVEGRPEADLDRLKHEIIALLRERHGEEDITVLTQEAVMRSFSKILAVLTLALAAIGTVSLAVAGVGIMNVMLVSVSERTSEIGLLKALGVQRHQILSVFVTEAGLLSAAGAVSGLALGRLGVALTVRLYPALPARPPLWAAATALGVALAVGLFFGVLPARRASRLDPVIALAQR